MHTWNRIKGATYLPENVVITVGGEQYDIGSLTAKVYIVNKNDDTDVVANNVTTGLTVHPTQTFTASATTDRLTCNSHGVKEGEQVVLSNSGGALPAGLAAATRYHASSVSPNSFMLSDWKGGPTIDVTGAGTGTHSFYILGSVQLDLQTTWVDSPGSFEVRLNFYSGSEYATVPIDEVGILLNVIAPNGAWI
jgi:hypothetical protein